MPNFDILLVNQILTPFCSLLLFVVMLLNKQHIFAEDAKGGTGYVVLFFTMVFYSLFYVSSEGGDLYTSMFVYQAYLEGGAPENLHFEPVYFAIMDLIPFGYVYWRFFVWGLAAAIMLYVLKKMNCNIHLATLFMCYYCIPRPFYYQRVSLGFAFLFLGLYYFLRWKEEQRNWHVFKALLFFVTCVCFHRSMPLYVVIALVAVYLPLNKSNWYFYVILIPILSLFGNNLGMFFLSQSEEMHDAGIAYLNVGSQHAARNIGGLIYEFLSWGPLAGMTFYALYDYIRHPYDFTLTSKTMLLFGAILYISSLALAGQTSGWFLGKMQMQCIFPLTFFFTLYFDGRRETAPCYYFMVVAIGVYLIQNISSFLL